MPRNGHKTAKTRKPELKQEGKSCGAASTTLPPTPTNSSATVRVAEMSASAKAKHAQANIATANNATTEEENVGMPMFV